MALNIGMMRIPLTTRFGELLIENGLASPAQVSLALARQEDLRLQNQNIRIGELLHKECGIDKKAMENLFRTDIFRQILMRLRMLISEEADLPKALSCIPIQARITGEGDEGLQGEADFQILLPGKQEQAFSLCLTFDFRFSDHSTTIDLPEAIDQIKKGLHEAMDIPVTEQEQIGLPIDNLRSLPPETEDT
ncbi:hypothetical protein LZ24_02184 [Desulfobotulus alkaliphilus]|uniref:Uncharacterized protein n=1 Tax=Desulfobotulus alkaliphilus TaxID=622671 RepID=A0A562RPB2_9BACT|nr:hypothetical protein [Desulfobotulus alkaliphilus]TWI70763.1 hypothetical protein LZ24_02184 [Desulfobotulus alkaliphilus]